MYWYLLYVGRCSNRKCCCSSLSSRGRRGTSTACKGSPHLSSHEAQPSLLGHSQNRCHVSWWCHSDVITLVLQVCSFTDATVDGRRHINVELNVNVENVKIEILLFGWIMCKLLNYIFTWRFRGAGGLLSALISVCRRPLWVPTTSVKKVEQLVCYLTGDMELGQSEDSLQTTLINGWNWTWWCPQCPTAAWKLSSI